MPAKILSALHVSPAKEPEDHSSAAAERQGNRASKHLHAFWKHHNHRLRLPVAMHLLNNWTVEMQFERARLAGKITWRARVERFLACPLSSRSAYCFSAFILLTSLTSVIGFGLESTQQARYVREGIELFDDNVSAIEEYLDANLEPIWPIWTLSLCIFFAVEFVLRCVTYTAPWNDLMLWVDLLALLPLLLRVTLQTEAFSSTALELYLPGRFQNVPGGAAIHLNAAFGSLRLLKMTRYMIGFDVLRKTVNESLTSLIIPSYLLFMLCTFLGTLVFALEYSPYDLDNGSRVGGVTTSWWLLLVTMTTVGYGDYSPQSAPGRIVMAFAMIIGLSVLAMPLAIVGNNFDEAWKARQRAPRRPLAHSRPR